MLLVIMIMMVMMLMKMMVMMLAVMGYDDDGADHGGDHVDVADDVGGDDEDQYCNMNRRKAKCGPEHQHGNGRGCNGGMTQ